MLGAGRDITQLFESYHKDEILKLETSLSFLLIKLRNSAYSIDS